MAYSKATKLIIKHLSFERTGLGFASVKHFAETGNISGELYGRIKDMVDEALAETPDASDNALPIDIVKPRFSEITKETGSGFAWLFKAQNHACEANDNSAMIRTLAEKYNEIVKFLNGA